MSRKSLTYSSLAKLIVFTMASLVVTGLLAAIMGNIGFGDTTAYSARFTTASMLQPGDDVRVAGVIMGEVSEVEIEDRTQALVTFTVKNGLPMTQDSGAEIRFLNLVGDRYLTLTQGEPGAPALSPGATIPIARTSPALNLTTLFNGFQPLFAALAPEDVNELSMNLVRTLQGEGGTVESLLAHTASLTTTLADRDQLIGDVINNLNTMLGTVDSKREELSLLITELRRWVGGLSEDRVAIGESLQSISDLTGVTADLLQDGRPLIKADIAQLRELAKRLAEPRNKAEIRAMLDRTPETLTDQTRTGTYGAWYQYYLCEFSGQITLPGIDPGLPPEVKEVLEQIIGELGEQISSFAFYSNAPRCK